MARVYVFGDEGGDLVFARKPSVSRYFIIGTVTMGDCSVGNKLLELRRELAWQGTQLEMFHATSDKQRVRDRVYDVLANSDLRIDATILDKRKAQDHLRNDTLYFYKMAWFLHFKYVAPQICGPLDDLFVVASSLQIKKKKQGVKKAVADVVLQASPTAVFHSAFFAAASDPCLQAADYATWAVQRKWERNDSRSYNLIRPKIATAFEPFAIGSKTYY
jgi:hypothetical protein